MSAFRTSRQDLSRPDSGLLPTIRSSRSIERIEYRKRLEDSENTPHHTALLELRRLQDTNNASHENDPILHTNLQRALRINHLLTGNMMREQRLPC